MNAQVPRENAAVIAGMGAESDGQIDARSSRELLICLCRLRQGVLAASLAILRIHSVRPVSGVEVGVQTTV